MTIVLSLAACRHTERQEGALSRAQCLEMIRKQGRLHSGDSAEQAETDRRERAAVEECLRSGTVRMFECIERAPDLGELEECERWKGK